MLFTRKICFKITQSAGNHGQALAWSARNLGISCIVVVPDNANPSKVEAIESYGAMVEYGGKSFSEL